VQFWRSLLYFALFRIRLSPIEMSKCEIKICGSCNVDYVCRLPRLPRPGETLQGSANGFSTKFGGKGGNSCYMAGLLSNHTSRLAMVGCVGSDDIGKQYKERLRSLGVNVDYVHVKENSTTGAAIIYVGNDDGNNMIGLNAGANFDLVPSDLPPLAEWKDCIVLLVQNEIRMEVTEQALSMGRSVDSICIFNPSPMDELIVESRLVYKANILVVNEEELESLNKMIRLESNIETHSTQESISIVQSISKQMMCFLESIRHSDNVKLLIVTLGPNGVMYQHTSWSEAKLVKADIVSPRDTTGAGDAFCGSLAVLIARGYTLDDAVKSASSIATQTVLKEGAQESYPNMVDLQDIGINISSGSKEEINCWMDFNVSIKSE